MVWHFSPGQHSRACALFFARGFFFLTLVVSMTPGGEFSAISLPLRQVPRAFGGSFLSDMMIRLVFSADDGKCGFVRQLAHFSAGRSSLLEQRLWRAHLAHATA